MGKSDSSWKLNNSSFRIKDLNTKNSRLTTQQPRLVTSHAHEQLCRSSEASKLMQVRRTQSTNTSGIRIEAPERLFNLQAVGRLVALSGASPVMIAYAEILDDIEVPGPTGVQ